MRYRRWRRVLALMLVLTALCSLTAYAEPTASTQQASAADTAAASAESAPAEKGSTKDKPDSELTDAELIAKYNIPNNWARPALIFALRHGLLPMGQINQLRPNEQVSRGSLAYMIMQVAGTKQAGDLSAFTDVSTSDWSYTYLARAYALGAIRGTSETTMSPHAKVTREQVFTILARLFGLRATDRSAIYAFSDWQSVSDWAALDVAAMIQAGYVQGAEGALKPQGYLNRSEAAQLFYNLLTDLGRKIPAKVSGRYALQAETVPSGTVVNGDLLLCNEASQITLDHVTVTGRLIVQGIGGLHLHLNSCRIGTLTLCRNTVLYLNGCKAKVVCNAPYVNVKTDAEQVEIWDSYVTLTDHMTVQRADLMTAQSRLYVRGTVNEVHTWANGAGVYGTGRVETLISHVKEPSVHVTVGSQSEELLPNLSDVTVTKQENTKASKEAPKAVASVKLQNLPQPQREYRVTWYCDSKSVYSKNHLLLKDGDVISTTMDFTAWVNASNPPDTVPIKFELVSGSEKRTFSYTAEIDHPQVSDTVIQQAKAVRTQNIQAKVLTSCNLYSDGNLTSKIGTVQSGTWVTYILYNNKNGYYYSAKIRLSNGTVGWVKHSNLQVSTGDFYVTWDYSTEVKEYWVNNIKNASSSTGYLIWASLYTQRVNIFKGSAGNWKLVKCFPCSSGLNTSNTPPEDKTIQSKTAKWYFSDDGNYYVDHVTVLDARGRAFHSRPKNMDGSVKDYTMGKPSSHGCMRMMDDGVQYIYNNCPIGTKVVLF